MPSVPLPTGDPDPAVTLTLAPLRKALRAVLYAPSDDMARPILTGVHVYWKGGIEPLVMEATDSYRLHQVKSSFNGALRGSFEGPFDVIVPGRWLRVTVAALGGGHTSTLSFAGGQVTATGYGESRTTSLIQPGTLVYPNVEQFMAPGEHHPDHEIAVTGRYLADMFKVAALWPSDPIRFTIPDGLSMPMHVTIKPPDTLVTLVLMPVRVPVRVP